MIKSYHTFLFKKSLKFEHLLTDYKIYTNYEIIGVTLRSGDFKESFSKYLKKVGSGWVIMTRA